MNSCCVRWSAAWNFSSQNVFASVPTIFLQEWFRQEPFWRANSAFDFLSRKTCSLTNTTEDELRVQWTPKIENICLVSLLGVWVCCNVASKHKTSCIWRLHKSSTPVFTFSPFIIACRREKRFHCQLQPAKKKEVQRSRHKQHKGEERRCSAGWEFSDGNSHKFSSFGAREFESFCMLNRLPKVKKSIRLSEHGCCNQNKWRHWIFQLLTYFDENWRVGD